MGSASMHRIALSCRPTMMRRKPSHLRVFIASVGHDLTSLPQDGMIIHPSYGDRGNILFAACQGVDTQGSLGNLPNSGDQRSQPFLHLV